MKSYSIVLMTLLLLTSCRGDEQSQGGGRGQQGQQGQRGQRGQSGQMNGGPEENTMAVPIEVSPVKRDRIAQHFETNGALEAENEVDLVARTNGPVVELMAEEGDRVKKDQLLARLDAREAQSQVAISKVGRDEAQMSLNRSLRSFEGGLISQELHDAAVSKLQAAQAQLEAAELQLTYTEIRAPFDAVVVARNIKNAQYVTNGTTLFRVSDFGLLLCRVEIPERELSSLNPGQKARVEVDAFRDLVFSAQVLRVRPTVDSLSGTVMVTLEVDGKNKLRPGMFASVYLEVAAHNDAVVIERDALVLDAIGDTVFIASDGIAERRQIKLGFREANRVEVLEGLSGGEQLIVLGQDGLAEGTPVRVLSNDSVPRTDGARNREGKPPIDEDPHVDEEPPVDKDQQEMMRQRMRDRGMSDEQIEERLKSFRSGGARPPREGRPPQEGRPPKEGRPPGDDRPGPGQRPPRGMGDGGGGLPPRMVERIKAASPSDLDRIRERMRSFGMSDEKIDETIRSIRNEDEE